MAENIHLSVKNSHRRIPHVRSLFSNLTEQQKIILEREKLRAEQQVLLKKYNEFNNRKSNGKNVSFSLSTSEVINSTNSFNYPNQKNSHFRTDIKENTGPLKYIKIVQFKLKKPIHQANLKPSNHLPFSPSEFSSKVKISTKNKLHSLNNKFDTNKTFKIPELFNRKKT